ncbi:hypothetical protein [Acinetobacter variabilis]|uniref:hypothetical protein n=1 Tax=Acinetobacter variabilis TaxID=70346 RepID=UPI002550E755|nr:hypothetical protein [Acinetobacter variabilis]
MNRDYAKHKDLIHKAIDLGLNGEAQQLLTTIQMKEMILGQQKKQIQEINEWMLSMSRNLTREVEEKERGAND